MCLSVFCTCENVSVCQNASVYVWYLYECRPTAVSTQIRRIELDGEIETVNHFDRQILSSTISSFKSEGLHSLQWLGQE